MIALHAAALADTIILTEPKIQINRYVLTFIETEIVYGTFTNDGAVFRDKKQL